jgi:hypothetical protein
MIVPFVKLGLGLVDISLIIHGYYLTVNVTDYK